MVGRENRGGGDGALEFLRPEHLAGSSIHGMERPIEAADVQVLIIDRGRAHDPHLDTLPELERFGGRLADLSAWFAQGGSPELLSGRIVNGIHLTVTACEVDGTIVDDGSAKEAATLGAPYHTECAGRLEGRCGSVGGVLEEHGPVLSGPQRGRGCQHGQQKQWTS